MVPAMVDKAYYTEFPVDLDHGKPIAKHGGLEELLRDHQFAGLVDIAVLIPDFNGGKPFGELGGVIKLGLDDKFAPVIDITRLGAGSLGHNHCCQPFRKGECGQVIEIGDRSYRSDRCSPTCSPFFTDALPFRKIDALSKLGGITMFPLASMKPSLPLTWTAASPSEKMEAESNWGGMTVVPPRSQ